MSASRLSIASFRAERILYDQHGLLVVDKPAGIPTYGGDESLRHGLTVRVGDWLEAQGRSPRLGVHQRLDQETSGALLFTTDPAQDEPVRRALEGHTIARTYRAVVHDPRGTLRDADLELLLDDDGKRSRVVRTGGKRAVTSVRVLERVGPRAHLELQLQTGRLHQIRVTLAHLGAPVLGDRLYGGPPAERLFLHALLLAGAPLPESIEAPLPSAFTRALQGSTAGPTGESELCALVRDAITRRAPLLAQTNALRLLQGDAEGLPGVEVDVVGRFARVVWKGDAAPSDALLDVIAGELEACGVLGVGAAPQREPGGPSAAAPAGALAWRGVEPTGPVVVEEGSARSEWMRVEDAWFVCAPPLRPLRERVRAWLREGDRSLSLGAGVGGVLLAAGEGASASGALAPSRTLVDRSKATLARLRALLNESSSGVRLLHEEPLAFAEREVRRGHRYELVVLDLTLARGERERLQLLRSALAIAAPGGKLVVARRPLAMGGRLLRRHVHEAATLLGRTLRYAKELPLPFDVPSSAPEEGGPGGESGSDARRPLVVELE